MRSCVRTPRPLSQRTCRMKSSPTRAAMPLALRSMQLENRIVVSPLAQFMADAEGCATDWHLMHLGSLALSGASLLVIEATAAEHGRRMDPEHYGAMVFAADGPLPDEVAALIQRWLAEQKDLYR